METCRELSKSLPSRKRLCGKNSLERSLSVTTLETFKHERYLLNILGEEKYNKQMIGRVACGTENSLKDSEDCPSTLYLLEMLPFKDCNEIEESYLISETSIIAATPSVDFDKEITLLNLNDCTCKNKEDNSLKLATLDNSEVSSANFNQSLSEDVNEEITLPVDLEEMYPQTCYICFDYVIGILTCDSCRVVACSSCISNHIQTKILNGAVLISCVGSSCKKEYPDQLLQEYAPDVMAIYTKNKIELENNPNLKTCPGCHVVEKTPVRDKKINTKDLNKIVCTSCRTPWCFDCHAPWHRNMSCKQFQTDVLGPGEKALKYWAKTKSEVLNNNARKCPKCKIYIERVSGCDHMTCDKCHTDFCYKCGKRHYSLRFFGDHYSTYSFFGCKYNLFPDKPLVRIPVRSAAVFGCVLFGPPIVALTGVVLILGSPFILGKIIKNKCC